MSPISALFIVYFPRSIRIRVAGIDIAGAKSISCSVKISDECGEAIVSDCKDYALYRMSSGSLLAFEGVATLNDDQFSKCSLDWFYDKSKPVTLTLFDEHGIEIRKYQVDGSLERTNNLHECAEIFITIAQNSSAGFEDKSFMR